MECAESARRQVIEHRGTDKGMGDVDHAPAAADLQVDQPVPDGLRQRAGEVDRRRSCAPAPSSSRAPATATAATRCSVSNEQPARRLSTIVA